MRDGVGFWCPETHEVFVPNNRIHNDGREYTQWRRVKSRRKPDLAAVAKQELTPHLRHRMSLGVATPDRYQFEQPPGFDFTTRPTLSYVYPASERSGSNIWVLQHGNNITGTHKDEIYAAFFSKHAPERHGAVSIVDTTGHSNAAKAIEVYLAANRINVPLFTFAKSMYPYFRWRTSTDDPNSPMVGEFGVDLREFYDPERINHIVHAFFSERPELTITNHLAPRDRQLVSAAHNPRNSLEKSTYLSRQSFLCESRLRRHDLNRPVLDCTNPGEREPLQDYDTVIDMALTGEEWPVSVRRPASVAECDYVITSTGTGTRLKELRRAADDTQVLGIALDGQHAIAEHYTGTPCTPDTCLPDHLSNRFMTDMLTELLASDREHGHIVVDPEHATYLARGYRDRHMQGLVDPDVCDAGILPLAVLANGGGRLIEPVYQRERQPQRLEIPPGSTVLLELTNGIQQSASQIIADQYAA